jgi:hypothetical protein
MLEAMMGDSALLRDVVLILWGGALIAFVIALWVCR